MIEQSHEFLRAWRDFESTPKPYYLLPGDEALEQQPKLATTTPPRFDDFDAPTSKRLFLSLMPQPMYGDLVRASVVLLLANPGVRAVDVRVEKHWPEFREALIATMRGARRGCEFPNLFLDPAFHAHPGFNYFQTRLREVRDALVERTGLDPMAVQALLAREVAVVQVSPYRSRNFGLPERVLQKLRSSLLARSFVRDVLVPRAREGQTLLVVMRGERWWRVREERGVVVDRKNRSAYLPLNRPAGEKVLEQLLRRADESTTSSLRTAALG